jgi:hypothetical protein
MCRTRKNEMYDLVKRCLDLKKKSTDGQMIPACKEILSAYCYVFSSQDIMTCRLNDHDAYVPGKKASTTPSLVTARSTVRPTTTTIRSTSTIRPTFAIRTTATVRPATAPPSQKSPFELIPGFSGTVNSVIIFFLFVFLL